MADEAGQDTIEDVIKDHNITDFDPENPREKMFMGIITKLRGQKRSVAGERDNFKTQLESTTQELNGFRRTSKESEITSKVLGDGLEIGDKAKFEKYKGKIVANKADGWEAELEDLIKDFAVPKKRSETTENPEDAEKARKAADEKAAKEKADAEAAAKAEEEKNKRPAYRPRFLKGARTEEVTGTAVPAPKSFSQKMRLAQEDPEAFKEMVAKRRK